VTSEPVLPAYGVGALSDVTPSVLAALGVPGGRPVLGLPETRHVRLLLVDGLGWELLQQHRDDAPFLSGLAGDPITAGFPATTAASLASVGTGLAPAAHGIVGLSFEVGDHVAMNALGWNADGRDLRERFPPEDVQPDRTTFERMADDGVMVQVAVPAKHAGSGLTRAVLRGGEVRGILALGDLAAGASEPPDGDRTFRYAYHGDLDMLGHVFGPGSDAWRLQLVQVDQLARSMAERLPPGGLLLVTADHGMVRASDHVDVEELTDGVRLLAGEPRVRHVYAEPGAAADVLAAWRETLGDRAWVRSREEAVAAGWFGPGATPRTTRRIGDVVAAARGGTALIAPGAEPMLSALPGQHGSLTTAELAIPLLRYQA
jgi:hypothetical protein